MNSGKSVWVQGEINVSAAGLITIRFNSTKGLAGWLDEKPLPEGTAPTVVVEEGTHRLTLKVDLAARNAEPIRVEVTKPEGASAEFSVVGGR